MNFIRPYGFRSLERWKRQRQSAYLWSPGSLNRPLRGHYLWKMAFVMGSFHTNRPMEKDELSACLHPFYFSGNLCDYTHLRGKDSTLLGNLSFLAVEPTWAKTSQDAVLFSQEKHVPLTLETPIWCTLLRPWGGWGSP